MILNAVVGAALVLGLLAGMFLAVLLLRRFPQVGAVVAAAFALSAWELPSPPPLLETAGVSVYIADLLSIVFLAVAATELPRIRRNLGALWWGWAVLAILLVASFVRGAASYDLGPVVVEARTFLYPVAALLWALSLPWAADNARDGIRRFSLFLGWGLTIVAVAHLIVYGFGGASDFVDPATGFDQTQRPLVAGQAFTLLLCAIVVLAAWAKARRPVLALSGIGFVVVLVLAQQRSVWVAAAAAALVALILGSEHSRVGYLVGALALTMIAIVVAISGVADSVVTVLGGSVSDLGTFTARQTSWTALTAQSWADGPTSVLFGQPFGAGYGRFEGAGRWVEFAPHNWYISIYLRAGLVGLICFVATLAGIAARVVRSGTPDRTSKVAVLTAFVVFGGAYSWLWYTALFFGWAASSPSSDVIRPRSSPDRVPAARGGA